MQTGIIFNEHYTQRRKHYTCCNKAFMKFGEKLMNEKTAVVTGANGFIGSAMTKYLSAQGVEVWALVQSGSDLSVFEGCGLIHTVPFSLGQPFEAIPMLPDKPDLFYHFAWKSVSDEHKNSPEVQLQNIKFSLDTLRLAESINAKKIIFAGTVAEYAYNGEHITGDDLSAPNNFYGAAKASARIFCTLYAYQHNLPFIWTIISSIYGPGRCDNNLITYAITSLLKGEKPSFTKLEQMWSYIYIDDLMSALYLVGLNGKSGTTYPIGSGERKRLYEFIDIIRNAVNPSLPVGIGDILYKKAQIDNSVVDIELLTECGFTPRFTFEEGIKPTIEYFKQKL